MGNPMKLITLTFLLLAGFMLGLGQGAMGPGLIEDAFAGNEHAQMILVEYRLPRLLAALFIGAGLGMSGACLQGVTRNPLADHSLLGMSGFAALFCVVSFYLFSQQNSLMLFLVSFAGAGFAMMLVYVAVGKGAVDSTKLILMGLALNAMASALIALTLNLAPNPFAGFEALRWLLGSLDGIGLQDLPIIATCSLLGLLLLSMTGKGLNLLSLGPDEAISLGLRGRGFILLIILGSGLIIASGVAAAGVVGFVGIIAPHIARAFWGALPSTLLWPSALIGAIITLMADQLVMALDQQIPLQLGVVTGLIGAPFFIYLIGKGHRSWS